MKGEVVFTDHMFLDYYASKSKKKTIGMGTHPVIYAVLQLHVVKFNQNVLNGLELENKWGKSGVRKSAQSHTPSAMKFVSHHAEKLRKTTDAYSCFTGLF